MKMTKSQLQQIIKEEIENLGPNFLAEAMAPQLNFSKITREIQAKVKELMEAYIETLMFRDDVTYGTIDYSIDKAISDLFFEIPKRRRKVHGERNPEAPSAKHEPRRPKGKQSSLSGPLGYIPPPESPQGLSEEHA